MGLTILTQGTRKEYIGTDDTVDFMATWDSENENVSLGQEEIT
jgi:hypothetical protein